MNEIMEKIMAKYRCADFNERLHLYLQYPELRSIFLEIDKNGEETEALSEAV